MARVFITGSSDGLGLMAARLLVEQGHEVVVHGRNDARRVDALRAASKAKGGVSGELSTIAGARSVAEQVNKLGRFDAVILWNPLICSENPWKRLKRPWIFH